MHVYSYSSVAECGKHMGPWMAIVGHLDEVQPTDIIDPPYASGTMQATLCLPCTNVTVTVPIPKTTRHGLPVDLSLRMF